MQTQCLSCNGSQSLDYAVQLLRAGYAIAFPTDTVYGLGADGFNERAIEQLFVVKERERGKAIPYLLAGTSDLAQVAREMPRAAQLLAEKFWPGGLTLVVPASPRVPKILVAGGDTVAVRVPDQPITRALIAKMGVPLATTSANLSGGPDPANAQEVLAQLTGRIPLVLDGGATRGNIPSTVVDVTTDPPRVLRVGVIAVQEIEQVVGRVN